MLSLEEWMDIKLLRQQGHSIKEISRLTGHSRNTVRKALRAKAQQPFQKPHRSSKLDPFKPYIKQRYEECALSSVRLLDEIRPMGYTGSLQTLRRFVHLLRPQRLLLEKMTVRFETPPGKQAQADWAYLGRFENASGQLIPIYVFVMVLSFSRYMFVEFTTSMKIDTLISCHLHAFEFFGGWSESILYDNMKQVRLSRDHLNPLFVDFTSHYGIVPKTHKPLRPRTKGKVERMVDYVKDNFLNGRTFTDVADLNSQGRNWLDQVANVRIHATTNQRPLDLLGQENLIPLSSQRPYQISLKATRKVTTEGFVRFLGSRYSVPPEQVGQVVLVEQGEQKIIIRCEEMIIAEHTLADRKGATVASSEHIEAMWKLTLNRQAPPAPHWEVTFQQAVQAPSLSVYEEVGR